MGRFGDAVRATLFAPLRALLPRNPWLRLLVCALPVVLLLALFGPAVDVLLKLVDLGFRVLEPLLQTTVGRLLLLLVVFTLGGAFTVWLLKSRVGALRGEAALGRHLLATAALVGQGRKSRERFRRVARYRGPAPERYPCVVQDANLKLARSCLEAGQIDEALAWLVRVVEAGLPRELQRSLLQLRVRALRLQGEVLPATLEQEVRGALGRFPDDYVLLGELRDLLAQRADPVELAATQELVAKHAPPAAALRERQRWCDELGRAGRALLRAGDHDGCRRIAKKLAHADPGGSAGGLLLGDLHRARGDHRAAIVAYGATRSPEGLDRVAELLAEHPGAVEPRELLECCPLQGTLLLVARELARAGDQQRAERAARLAAESLGPTATVCAVLAEVLELLGQQAKAALLREQTIARLLQPGEPRAGAGGGT